MRRRYNVTSSSLAVHIPRFIPEIYFCQQGMWASLDQMNWLAKSSAGFARNFIVAILPSNIHTQVTRFMGPTWGPPGSCRPQMGPMLAPWTLLSGYKISFAFFGFVIQILVWHTKTQQFNPDRIQSRVETIVRRLHEEGVGYQPILSDVWQMYTNPNSKVHVANMGPIWGWQDPCRWASCWP